MIGMAGNQLLRAVDLLDKQAARQEMWPGHIAKRQHQPGLLEQRLTMSVGASDQESGIGDSLIPPLLQLACEGLARELLAATIEGDQQRSLGNGGKEELALALDQLRRRQFPLLLDFVQNERPTNATGIVLVKIALGSARGAAHCGDRDFHPPR